MSQVEQEPTDADAPDRAEPNEPRLKGRRSFSRMRRELNDDELAQPAVQKLMMDELDRLESENAQLKTYVEKYHDADKQVSVLREKQHTSRASDLAFGTLLTVGSAAIGYSPTLKAPGSNHDAIVLVFGIILFLAGLAVKVLRK